jgi:hypothetical protein
MRLFQALLLLHIPLRAPSHPTPRQPASNDARFQDPTARQICVLISCETVRCLLRLGFAPCPRSSGGGGTGRSHDIDLGVIVCGWLSAFGRRKISNYPTCEHRKDANSLVVWLFIICSEQVIEARASRIRGRVVLRCVVPPVSRLRLQAYTGRPE